ncbi:MAG: photosynthetic reaction center cytochrome c subunit [Fimbriimonadaceae bacterium]|jgi:hypothetical protein|nr:photosynthetic reaction center cytochrome c subunit [Fimbriimonadaceae bacterium]
MTWRVGLHVLSLAVFAIAIAGWSPQAEGDKPAEKEFKNIKVFTGVPAKEIVPAMRFISASLGVGCDHCHVTADKGAWPMEKDDKKEKDTARQMVLMTRQINENNFAGRQEVTCATCHQGRAHPLSMPPLGEGPPPVQATAAVAATLPTAESLVDKYTEAIGGPTIDKLTSLRMKGTELGRQGRTQGVETFTKAPDKSLVVLTLPRGNFSEAFDGSVAWRQALNGEVFTLRNLDLEEVKRAAPFYWNMKLKDQFKTYRRVRKDTLDGKDVFVVDAQPVEAGYRERLYFDASSGLLVRRWSGRQTILGILPYTQDFTDYREVSGVKVPFKVTLSGPDGTVAVQYTEGQGNVDIPDAKFTKPVEKGG